MTLTSATSFFNDVPTISKGMIFEIPNFIEHFFTNPFQDLRQVWANRTESGVLC
jgi:hypothetical protein